jgi:hypothetical protein
MSKGFLESRRVALEESFFAEHNEKLLEKLRTAARQRKTKEAISAILGVDDDAVLQQLVDLGLCEESVVALYLVPMIEVAWADGEIQAKERDAVLKAADEHGIERESVAYELLACWLEQPVDKELLGAWEGLARALKDDLAPGALQAMRAKIIDNARAVAEAAGGFLGLGKISPEERAMLERLSSALS